MDWTHRLRLRHLHMLESIAQTGNLSRSAKDLYTTQPAISKWLKELEADIGLPLFERHARGLRPTSHGEALLKHAQRIVGYLDNVREDMRALHDGGSGRVVLGTSGVSATGVVPLAITRLIEQRRRTRISLVESAMDHLMPQLLQGELDIVVGRTLFDASSPAQGELQSERLYVDPVNFVCGMHHPLLRRSSLTWSDLFDYPWIVWPRGTPIRNALEKALAAGELTLPAYCVESNSSLLNITLFAHSQIIGVASHSAALHFSKLKLLRILPMTLDVKGEVSMYWRDNESRQAVLLTLDCLREAARALPGAQAPAAPAGEQAMDLQGDLAQDRARLKLENVSTCAFDPKEGARAAPTAKERAVRSNARQKGMDKGADKGADKREQRRKRKK